MCSLFCILVRSHSWVGNWNVPCRCSSSVNLVINYALCNSVVFIRTERKQPRYQASYVSKLQLRQALNYSPTFAEYSMQVHCLQKLKWVINRACLNAVFPDVTRLLSWPLELHTPGSAWVINTVIDHQTCLYHTQCWSLHKETDLQEPFILFQRLRNFDR